MKLGDALMSAQALIAPASDSPRLEAELLLGHVMGLNRAPSFTLLRATRDAAAQTERQTLGTPPARTQPGG